MYVLLKKPMDIYASAYQKMMFKTAAAISTMVPSTTGCLYHARSRSFSLGVKEYTRPVSSSSVLVRGVIKEINTVTPRQTTKAQIAVQKF